MARADRSTFDNGYKCDAYRTAPHDHIFIKHFFFLTWQIGCNTVRMIDMTSSNSEGENVMTAKPNVAAICCTKTFFIHLKRHSHMSLKVYKQFANEKQNWLFGGGSGTTHNSSPRQNTIVAPKTAALLLVIVIPWQSCATLTIRIIQRCARPFCYTLYTEWWGMHIHAKGNAKNWMPIHARTTDCALSLPINISALCTNSPYAPG